MRHNVLFNNLQNLTMRTITQTEVANVLGYSAQVINKRSQRNSQYNEEEIEKLEQYYGQFVSTKSIKDNAYVEIPVLGEVNASCGSGVTVYNENQTSTYSISKELAKDIGVSLNNTEMIFAKGDSMYPTIDGGDSLLVDKSKTKIYDGKIYCVRINGQLYAKRLQLIPPQIIVVISDNEKYKTFEIDFSKDLECDFAVIGEIKWWGRIAR